MPDAQSPENAGDWGLLVATYYQTAQGFAQYVSQTSQAYAATEACGSCSAAWRYGTHGPFRWPPFRWYHPWCYGRHSR